MVAPVPSEQSQKITRTTESPVQEFIEMENHQYFPGYYTGGRVHPFFKSHSKIGKWFLLVVGSFWIVMSSWAMLSGLLAHEDLLNFFPQAIMIFLFGCLCFAAGVKM